MYIYNCINQRKINISGAKNCNRELKTVSAGLKKTFFLKSELTLVLFHLFLHKSELTLVLFHLI